jgi:hypothetical protein
MHPYAGTGSAKCKYQNAKWGRRGISPLPGLFSCTFVPIAYAMGYILMSLRDFLKKITGQFEYKKISNKDPRAGKERHAFAKCESKV